MKSEEHQKDFSGSNVVKNLNYTDYDLTYDEAESLILSDGKHISIYHIRMNFHAFVLVMN